MKSLLSKFSLVFCALFAVFGANAEIFSSTYKTKGVSDTELITKMIIGEGVSLKPGGDTLAQSGSKATQIGIFSNLNAQVISSFTNGVILSTGKIDADGSLENKSSIATTLPGRADDSEKLNDSSIPEDSDLRNLFPTGYLCNFASITLYIKPKNTTLNIPFVFASEHFFLGENNWDYPELDAYRDYSDKFAVFLQELGDEADVIINGTVQDPRATMVDNIAVLPDGSAIEPANVNQHTNQQWFISNVCANDDGDLGFPSVDINLPMEFNGAINGPTIVKDVDPNKVYKLKIIIADHVDNAVNSALFLRDRGITSGADLKVEIVPDSANLDSPGPASVTITVTNMDAATANGVKVRYDLPEGLDSDIVAVDSPALGSCEDIETDPSTGKRYLIWNIGDGFEKGETAELVVNFSNLPEGNWLNSAKVTTETGDYNEENDKAKCEIKVRAGAQPTPPIEVTVRAINTNKVYGSELLISDWRDFVEFESEGEGFDESLVAGITVEFFDVDSQQVYPTNKTTQVGNYIIRLTNLITTQNITADYADGSLDITRKDLLLKPKPITKRYGLTRALNFDVRIDPFMKKEGLVNGDKITAVEMESDGAAKTAPYRLNPYPLSIKEETIKINGKDNVNYNIIPEDGELKVSKKPLTITAKDEPKIYGEQKEFNGTEFEYPEEDVLAWDSIDRVELSSIGTDERATVDSYDIVASNATGAGVENYDVTYVQGTLTVEKADLTIKAVNKEKTYGTTFDASTFGYTPEGLKTWDRLDSVDYNCDGIAAIKPVVADGYRIEIIDNSWNGQGLDNYNITTVPGILAIKPFAVTITAEDKEKIYGETFVFAGDEFRLDKTLPNGETINSVALGSEGAASTANCTVDGYSISVVPGSATGTITPTNYDITYNPGVLRVNKKQIKITPNDREKTYGETTDLERTAFAAEPVSLPNGDKITEVTLESEGTVESKPVGEYDITIVDGSEVWSPVGAGNNYTVEYAKGKLKINPRLLTITAMNAEKTYGDNKQFTGDSTQFMAINLRAGDAIQTVHIQGEKAQDISAQVGDYEGDIEAGHPVIGINTNNYDITFNPGKLTVKRANLEIPVHNATWRVGKPKPSYHFEDFSANLKGGDNIADITGGNGLSTDVVFTNQVFQLQAPIASDVGSYPDEIWIDQNSLDGNRVGNYIVNIAPGTLEVVKAAPELQTDIVAKLNRSTGLLDLTLTIKNVGDGEVEDGYDYWVELVPGPAASGSAANVPKTYYLAGESGTMPDGADYIDLTTQVREKLRSIGNMDTVFDPGETVAIGGVSVYHWKRAKPSTFIDYSDFFVAGKMFNKVDSNKDFNISRNELNAASGILGSDSDEYMEATRLEQFPYYRWNKEQDNWIGTR